MDPSNPAAYRRQVKDFQSALQPIWCAGCGDFGAVQAIQLALAGLGLRPEQVVIVSGIGCSGRLPGYVHTYGFNGLHGRAIPFATGLKLARPDLTVLVVSGDGDSYAIGLGHLLHGIRRDVDLTCLVLDNGVYGLTKGHASPTTPAGERTPSTPAGVVERAPDPLALALAGGAGFVARATTGNIRHLGEMIAEGIRHPGFALVHASSPCPTYRGTGDYERHKTFARYLHLAGHDPRDRAQAQAALALTDAIALGVIYRDRERG